MDKQLLITYGIPALGGLLAFLLFFFCLLAGRRQRLVSDLPTSKTTGVFIGLVELKGTAEAEEPLVSFLAETGCVSYHWQVDEHWLRTVMETYRDSEGDADAHPDRNRLDHRRTGRRTNPFYLQDDCGMIRIQPDKAKVESRTVFDHTCGPGDDLYYGKGPSRSRCQLHLPPPVCRVRDPPPCPALRRRPGPRAGRCGGGRDRPRSRAEMFLISTRTRTGAPRPGLAVLALRSLSVGLSAGGFILTDAIQHHPLKPRSDYILVGVRPCPRMVPRLGRDGL